MARNFSLFVVTLLTFGIEEHTISTMAAPPAEIQSFAIGRPEWGGIDTQYCELYNSWAQCDSTNGPCNPSETLTCKTESTNITFNHCFVLWQYNNITNTAAVKLKGCFADTVACHERRSRCTVHNSRLLLMHCCCEGNMCNRDIKFPGLEAGLPSANEPPMDINEYYWQA